MDKRIIATAFGGLFVIVIAAAAPHGVMSSAQGDFICDHPGDDCCYCPHENPGCGWGACEQAVCEVAPQCCGVEWSGECVGFAFLYCAILELLDEPQACCLRDGTCEMLHHYECEAIGDAEWYCSETCGEVECPTEAGACCFGSTCVPDTLQEDCVAQGGDFGGVGSECTPNPCDRGACCVGGSCAVRTRDSCTANGGSYQGFDTECDPNPCPGACCLPDGTCMVMLEEACDAAKGSFDGSASCTTDICPKACCLPAAPCEILTEDDCTEAGGMPGGNVDCAESDCDVDGDGLLDAWETDGLDIDDNGVVDLDLPALGVDPLRKDLFIEVDAMEGASPNPLAIGLVIDAFDQARVMNPPPVRDGIRLHVLFDDLDLPVENPWITGGDGGFPLSFIDYKDEFFGTVDERDPENENRDFILAAKRLVYRYVIYGIRTDDNRLGGAQSTPGDNFAVAAGAIADLTTSLGYGNPDIEAATFMHEFGHCLGLRHGGDLEVNGKPNYLSVMNYLRFLPYWADLGDRNVWRLDYSYGTMLSLDERKLQEADGIRDTGATNSRQITYYGVAPCLPHLECEVETHSFEGKQATVGTTAGKFTFRYPADYDGDEDRTGVDVCADLNYFGSGSPIPGTKEPSPCDLLHDHNDWANLDYALVGSAARGGESPEELTVDDVLFLAESLPVPCEGDLDLDGAVTFADIRAILAAWGPCPGCYEDWNGDGDVGMYEVMVVIDAWGPCP